MIFLHFIGHPKRGKLSMKKGVVNGKKKTTTIHEGIKPLEIKETGQRKLFIFENSPRFQDVKRTYY
jgi:hypothetical protein